MPEIGDRAPDFDAVDTHGDPIRLRDYAGQVLVLYFYPKDSTPGCTREACDFRDHRTDLDRLGATVVGVSRDSARSHERFAAKHDLPFRLIVDQDEQVCTAYDVLHEKSSFGRLIFGVVRTTYVIDRDQVIRAKFGKVRVDGHVEEVIATVRSIVEA